SKHIPQDHRIIINSFGRIEDRLRALLELFRKQLIKGVPELNIPILDPLHINKIEFDVNHQAANAFEVENIDVAVKLTKLQNNFEGLMNDRDIGILFNKAISEMAPEALDILWPEIKLSVERQIKKDVGIQMNVRRL
ncbi:hypothetical protein NQ317_019388, partial [Molorchus minor]